MVGRVWRDHENPDAAAAVFPDGSVAVKLLFTTATVAEVPYLANSFEWDAHVSLAGSDTRAMRRVRLLQIDIGVRDTRANSTTGWVFGTFSYDGTNSGATPWDRMVPIGLMWGNDPTLTPAAYAAGARITESVIVNATIGGVPQHLGWLGRLNGPVDNPISACLSCHATAQHAYTGPVPLASAPVTEKMRFFRNLGPATPFTAGETSLDYSLQLAAGIRNFMDDRRPPDR